MPNWNYNSVTIQAPIAEVKKYLVREKKHYFFNMHLLYPKNFPSDDSTGEKNWDYDWFVDHTGSKWTPEIDTPCDCGDAGTDLYYDTARAPNNLLLERLHKLTGWTITNEYEEPGRGFEGTFECSQGKCTDDVRDYQPVCEICGEKKWQNCYDYEQEGSICDGCRVKG